MSLRTLTPQQLKAQVATIRAKVPQSDVIGLRIDGDWVGPATIELPNEVLRVAACRSVVALRDILSTHRASDGGLVLLTGLADSELGADVLARLAKGRLLQLHSWSVVKDLLRVREIDPKIARSTWIADLLIEDVQGCPSPASGILDAETVWEVLQRRIGIDRARPDVETLVRWGLRRENVERFASAPDELRRGLCERIAETAGRPGSLVLSTLENGAGADVLPLGLAAEVIFRSDGETRRDILEAGVRLRERYCGRSQDPPVVFRRWAEASRAVAEELLTADPRPTHGWLARTDAILADVGAASLAERSDLSPMGLDARVSGAAAAIETAMVSGSGEKLEAALAAVTSHRIARHDRPRISRLHMAQRLIAWIAASKKRSQPASFAEACRGYAGESAFVDWARSCLVGGDENPTLSQAFGAVLARVSALREEENRQFAKLLQDAGGSGAGILPVEAFLDEIVAPLGAQAPILLLVLDGMSVPVFRELAEDLEQKRWAQLAPETVGLRPVVSAFPSVTEVSRASLLSGRLCRGGAAEEKDAFENHEALRRLGSKLPPVLFHKPELAMAADGSLPSELHEALASPERRVIGAVVNAVDDHLLKGGQIAGNWLIESIRPLRSLLREAREAGRVVILVSDHGHVLDRGTDLMRGEREDGERWRRAIGEAGEGEVVLEGLRVLPPGVSDRRLIAAWTEKLRYGVKKTGYHGGVSPQEVVIPLGVFAHGDLKISGWTAAAHAAPDWWDDPAGRPRPSARQKPEQLRLDLDLPETGAIGSAGVAPPTAKKGWIDDLVASGVFVTQIGRVRRQLSDEDVRRFLEALDERGHAMTRAALANRLGQPLLRLGGLIASMQRVLNVDGYDVVTLESDTVRLNRELLLQQFGLTKR